MKQIKYRGHNGYDYAQASDEAAFVQEGESMTIQAHAEDADINTIVRRFGITGQLPENHRPPVYGDFSHVMDFRTAMDAVNAAKHAFAELPAEIRRRFGEDPQAYLEFFDNPANRDEAERLGLIKKRPQEAAPPAPPKEDGKSNPST